MAGRARPGDFVPPAVAQKRVSRYTFRMSRTYGDYWFYDPTATVYGSPRDVGLSFQDVHFDSESNRLHGWFFPAQYDEKTARALAEAPLPGIPASAGADRANRNNRGQSQGGHRKAKGTRRSSKAIASRRSIPPIDHLHDSDPAHASSSDHPQSEGNPQDNGHISRSSQESATVSANGRYDSHAMPHADRNGTADAMPGNRRHSPHDKNIADEAGNPRERSFTFTARAGISPGTSSSWHGCPSSGGTYSSLIIEASGGQPASRREPAPLPTVTPRLTTSRRGLIARIHRSSCSGSRWVHRSAQW